MKYEVIPCICGDIRHSIIHQASKEWGEYYRIPVVIQKKRGKFLLDTVTLLECNRVIDNDIFDVVYENGDIFINGIKNVKNIVDEADMRVPNKKYLDFKDGTFIQFPIEVKVPLLLKLYMKFYSGNIEGYIDVYVDKEGNVIHLNII